MTFRLGRQTRSDDQCEGNIESTADHGVGKKRRVGNETTFADMAVALEIAAAGDDCARLNTCVAADIRGRNETRGLVETSAAVDPYTRLDFAADGDDRAAPKERIDHQAPEVTRIVQAIHISVTV